MMIPKDKQIDPTKKKGFEADEKDSLIVNYIKDCVSRYQRSQGFIQYKKSCEAVKYLANQRWSPAEKRLRWGFQLGLMRAAKDTYISALKERFNVKDFIKVSARKSGESFQAMASDWTQFINNMLLSIDYKAHKMRQIRYLPEYGWSVSYAEYFHKTGYKLVPGIQEGTENGLAWSRQFDTLISEPRPRIVHPYNWAGNEKFGAKEGPYDIIIKRWYAKDIHDAGAMKDSEGKPLYNPEALKKAMERIKSGSQENSSYYHQPGDRDNDENAQQGERGFVDVYYFVGSLDGCTKFYGDPACYIIEAMDDMLLRKRVNMIEQAKSINHMQTNPYIGSPQTQTLLDGMRHHAKMQNLLMNIGIENTINNMTRYTVMDEDSFLNPEILKNPTGLNNMLYRNNTEEFFEPRIIMDQRSGSLQDFEMLRQIIKEDVQRVGPSDQDMANPAATDTRTATQSRMLQAAKNARVISVAEQISESIPEEVKYLTWLAMQYSTSEQLKFLDRDGQERRLSPEHIVAMHQNLVINIDDTILKNQDEEAMEKLEGAQAAMELIGDVPVEFRVNMARAVLREKGWARDEIDEIIPEAIPPQINTGGIDGVDTQNMESPVPGAIPTGTPGGPGGQAPGPVGGASPQLPAMPQPIPAPANPQAAANPALR